MLNVLYKRNNNKNIVKKLSISLCKTQKGKADYSYSSSGTENIITIIKYISLNDQSKFYFSESIVMFSTLLK